MWELAKNGDQGIAEYIVMKQDEDKKLDRKIGVLKSVKKEEKSEHK